MALITLIEIINLIIVSVVIGYIFLGYVSLRPKTVYDMMNPRKFDWNNLKFATLVAAPGVVLHELAHKFVAMGYGANATFQIFPLGLALGVVLKLINSPFLIIAPGGVFIGGLLGNDFAYRVTALAGPLVNLLLFVVAYLMLNYRKNLSRFEHSFWFLTKQINLILFIFNMLPFGPLDGAKVLFGS